MPPPLAILAHPPPPPPLLLLLLLFPLLLPLLLLLLNELELGRPPEESECDRSALASCTDIAKSSCSEIASSTASSDVVTEIMGLMIHFVGSLTMGRGRSGTIISAMFFTLANRVNKLTLLTSASFSAFLARLLMVALDSSISFCSAAIQGLTRGTAAEFPLPRPPSEARSDIFVFHSRVKREVQRSLIQREGETKN